MSNVQAVNTRRVDLYPSRISDKPSILERKDPVVYGERTKDCLLTSEQLDFYEKNGYLFLDSFLNKTEVEDLRKEANRLREMGSKSSAGEIIREPNGTEVRSIFAIHCEKGAFEDISKHPRLRHVVENILGSSVYVHQSRINYKPGFTGKEFYWHSDFETWHVEDGMPRMRALSCSIALDENFHYNGPLMVVPGSHKKFISCVGQTPDEHYKESLRKQEYGVPDHDSLTHMVNEAGIEAPTGKAGSIVLFDCNTMHGSNSNITPKSRNNVFMVFNSVENKLEEPFSGQKPRPGYIGTRD
ncbi:MAG: ectoine hydroxylase [Paenibacillaceae bacterium]